MSGTERNLSLPRAQVLICRETPLVGIQSALLKDCLHRIIRGDIVSRRDYPAADVAERDGFCLPASRTRGATNECPAFIDLEGSLNAGEKPKAGRRGSTFRIMTGAVLPGEGYAVIPSEEARVRKGLLVISRPVKPGAHVAKAGSVVKAGQRLARAGDVLNPPLMGLLAAAGVKRLKVARKVRIGVLATGDEIVDMESRAKPWQAYNSNAVMLSGQVEALGAEVIRLGISDDTTGGIADRLRSARRCDVVVVTGGSSSGARDMVLSALESQGCRILLKGIRLRPGLGVIFARRGRQVLFGLPGRPAGCFVLFHLLVAPVVRSMMGSAEPMPSRIRGIWKAGRVKRPGVDTLVGSMVKGGSEVRPIGDLGDLDLALIARSNALVLVKSGRGLLSRGEPVEVFPITSFST
jgi:molybdenum cofactor synthesis domain-containing protein